jgi:hypothetical protein
MTRMNPRRIPIALAALLATTVAFSALAQGRHDEKPHGMKQIEEREMAEPRVHPGGPRHNELGHKAAIKAQKDRRAAAAKKDAAPAQPAKPAEAPAK